MVLPPAPGKKTRKHLSADALYQRVKGGFGQLPDPRPQSGIPLADALMSAFAMFSLKDPSLLAFDARRHDQNMKNLFGIDRVPSDTQMREILDLQDPLALRPVFNDVFRQLQRGKALERFVFHQGCYLLSMDGAVWKKFRSKRALWEKLRSHFDHFVFQSMQHLYEVMLHDLAKELPAPTPDTS